MPLWRVPSRSPSPRSLQVFLGDAEAVLGVAQDREPRLGGFAERRLVEQQAGRVAGAAADAAAQLVQLREAEALGVLDHHDGRLRHVDADLDHGGGDQQLRFAGGEARHRRVLLGALHAAVHQIDGLAELSCAVPRSASSAAARSIFSDSSTSGQTQ